MNNELFFDSEDYTYSNPPHASSGRKTLNQIFDVGSKPSKQSQDEESLHYTPPPQKTDSTKAESTVTATATATATTQQLSWSTRLAKIVIGFKNGETVGRVGVALLKSVEDNYRIILYKTKTNLLATYTLQDTRNLPHIHRQNCYWQFYDDNGIYWSLLFERSPDETDFINKLKECGIRVHPDLDLNLKSNKNQSEGYKMKAEQATSNAIAKKHISIREEGEENQSKSSDDDEDDKDEEEIVVDTHHTNTTLNDHHHHHHSKQIEIISNERSKLLMRLSKMGGKQLPMLGEAAAAAANIIDLAADSNHEMIDNATSLTIVGQTTYSKSPAEIHTQYVLPIAPTTAAASIAAASSSATVFSPAEAQMMQMMLVENRTQNAELRINIDKLESKIEKVMEKINRLSGNGERERSEDFFQLEEKLLQLKKENRRLKRETKSIGGKNDAYSEKIYSIYGVELSNLGIDVDATTSCQLDMDKVIGELIDKISSLQDQLDEKDNQLKNISSALRDQNERNHSDRKLNHQLSDQLEQAYRKIEALQSAIDKKKENEAQFNVRINDMKVQHSVQMNNIKLEMTETLKDIMNTLYHNLAQSIVSMEKLLPDKILGLIGQTIRQDTLSAVAKIGK